jgi:S1-C subfamily serine protease
MNRRFVVVLSLFAAIFVPLARADVSEVRRSVFRITTTMQAPDYRVPWNPGNMGRGVGAGFLLSDGRIMTNAHVVSDARFVEIEREGDPKKYTAAVAFIANDCDLAVLDVLDPSFRKGLKELELGGIPALESDVTALGYPIGGEHLSVTRGVVSRIDYQLYSHSGVDSHLAIQIDAAINPGNSGGPVVQNNKVVGVAFQGYSGDIAQNVGYMIPTPVIRRFLQDISDGKYDKYVDLAITTFHLLNPAQRRALGLAEGDDRGAYVSSVMPGGSADGIIKAGDVLLSIDGLPIASDASVLLDGERVEMPEVVERKFKGDKIDFVLLRDKKELNATLQLKGAWPYLIQAFGYGERPHYVVEGGLVFQPLNRNLMMAYNFDDLQTRYQYSYFVTDNLFVERPEVVVLASILPDPVNAYLTPLRGTVVDTVNVRKIRRLTDLRDAFAEPADTYVIKLLGQGRPVVLERAALDASRERIRQRYSLPADSYLGEKDDDDRLGATPEPVKSAANR